MGLSLELLTLGRNMLDIPELVDRIGILNTLADFYCVLNMS